MIELIKACQVNFCIVVMTALLLLFNFIYLIEFQKIILIANTIPKTNYNC